MRAASVALQAKLVVAARRQRGLQLFLLVGSRARDEARPDSDWDFAYLGDDRIDQFELLADLCRVLQTDKVDLADLGRAGGLLRYRAAKDALVLYERRSGCFREFWLAAVGFWCDAQPVIRANVSSTLNRLFGKA